MRSYLSSFPFVKSLLKESLLIACFSEHPFFYKSQFIYVGGNFRDHYCTKLQTASFGKSRHFQINMHQSVPTAVSASVLHLYGFRQNTLTSFYPHSRFACRHQRQTVLNVRVISSCLVGFLCERQIATGLTVKLQCTLI
jgi:hypothetical protein